LGFGFWVLGFGFWVLGFGFWVLGFGFWVSGSGFRVSPRGVVGLGVRVVLGSGVRGVVGFGVRDLWFTVSGFGVHHDNIRPLNWRRSLQCSGHESRVTRPAGQRDW